MTRRAALLAGAAALAGLVAAGCSGERGLVLWHSYSGAERAAFEETVAAFNTAHRGDGLRIEAVAMPYDGFADKLTAAIPNGNGPDLFVFANDRIGAWAEAGLAEPIEFFVDEELADRYEPSALGALAYAGSLYGLPLSVKCLALYYRTDRMSAPPRTTDELLAAGAALTDRAAGRYGLVYENTSLYGHAPWLFGFGGGLFAADGTPALATPEAAAALAFARRLIGPDGIVPPEMTATSIATLFLQGRASMAISGPWLLTDLDDHVPFAVASLPVVSATGRPAAPFLGVESVIMSSHARDKQAAFAAMAALAGDAAAVTRAHRARQVVPNRAAYDDPGVAADPVLAAFRAQLAVGVPMPATPAMRMVWTPYQRALEAVLVLGADPTDALAAAQREVVGYLAGRAP